MSQDGAGFSDGQQSSWWRVWAPLLARAGAIGLALLGLAGIGLAAARSESSPQLVRAPFTVGLAQLVGGGLDAPPVAPAQPRAQSALDAGVAPLPQPLGAQAARPQRTPLPCAPARAEERPPAGNGTRPESRGAESRGAAPPVTPGGAPPVTPGGALTADGRVVLNRAGPAELQRLPGIGAKRAEAILELRQRLGRFRRVSDLLRIKGIGPRLLERISPQLVLD